MAYTFLNFAEEVLLNESAALSAAKIYEIGVENGLFKKVHSNGKTPAKTLSAWLYLDIKNNPKSKFVQVSKRPALFSLKEKVDSVIVDAEVGNVKEPKEKSLFCERDLHQVLVNYVFSDAHFRCYTKTIYHEISTRKTGSHLNEWTHPDLIGVHFPFDDYDQLTIDTIDIFNSKLFKIYSFEMKKRINSSNLREEYFQAVSNSTWANEGYIVAPDIADDDDFLSELTLLNAAFGIGVIKLNLKNPIESEVLFIAKSKNELDYNMVDKLIGNNKDVKAVFDCIKDSNTLKKLAKSDVFDKVLSDDDFAKYSKEKHFNEE